MSLLLLFAGAGPQDVTPPPDVTAGGAGGGVLRRHGVRLHPPIEVDGDDEEAIAIVLALLDR